MMTIHNGIILIGRGNDFQLPGFTAYQPHPSAAKALNSGVIKLLLEVFKTAECFLDLLANAACRRTSAFLLHDLPEHRVIHVSTGIVANSGANIFRKTVAVAQQIFNTLVAKVRMFLQPPVQTVPVSAMMFIVMHSH